MKLSISNLTWGGTSLLDVAPQLKEAGMDGLEIAPTALWPKIDSVSPALVTSIKNELFRMGLNVSGIQSLLYGQPQLQLFDKSTWIPMRKHLEMMIEIAGSLEAKVVVFGSPKNRQKGTLDKGLANEIAAEFLSQLIPVLKRNGVVLTLEPNAPAYGSDYLINYLDVVELSALVSSSQIKPQIDTGCLWMVGEEPLSAFKICTPHHIHISTPYLGEVPGSLNFLDIFKEIKTSDFSGWLVIEALNKTIEQSIAMAKWLQSEIRGEV